MKNVLILNCMFSDKCRNDFRELLEEYMEEFGANYKIVNIKEYEKPEDKELLQFSHLIISGSQACAMEENKWNKNLEETIRFFVNSKKAILGICYGHQFLARTLLSKEALRKSHSPEVGFAKVNIKKHPLFKDIENPVFAIAHFDEVYKLNDDFTVLADSKNTAIQAYQYKNLPVYGVQFHPEYGVSHNELNVSDFKEEDPSMNFEILEDMKDEKELLQNKLVFRNFLLEDEFCIRPHHLMCFQTYVGKGYSEDFVKNMDGVVGSLRKNPEQFIRIVKGNENICAYCPNNIDGMHCISEEKVTDMDEKVLEYLGIEYNIYKYKDLLEMMHRKIDENIQRKICGKCQWVELCFS